MLLRQNICSCIKTSFKPAAVKSLGWGGPMLVACQFYPSAKSSFAHFPEKLQLSNSCQTFAAHQ